MGDRLTSAATLQDRLFARRSSSEESAVLARFADAEREVWVDASLVTEFVIRPQDGVSLTYKLWMRSDEDDLFELGSVEGERESVHHWVFLPPLAPKIELMYSVDGFGCDDTFWCVEVAVRQRLASDITQWSTRGSWTEVRLQRASGGRRENDARRRVLLLAGVTAE